ncbi:MAG: hypothetical protein Q7U04_08970 [Bacteriovorax sp.]|nr:hypothetical protein [Bacteriovorax sp.]
MNDTEYIVGVYNYINAFPEIHSDSAYYLLYLLDEKGLLDKSAARKLYDDRFKSELSSADIHQNMIGPFDSTDALNQFAFQLCEELNAEKVSLLSVQEYNGLLESSQTASDFHRDLLLKGNIMENIERKKKGFLRRFF